MSKNTKHKTSIGGQALIEGIMMRGPKGTAMSLRLPDGTIETELEEYIPWKNKCKILYNKVVYIDERITYRVRLTMMEPVQEIMT